MPPPSPPLPSGIPSGCQQCCDPSFFYPGQTLTVDEWAINQHFPSTTDMEWWGNGTLSWDGSAFVGDVWVELRDNTAGYYYYQQWSPYSITVSCSVVNGVRTYNWSVNGTSFTDQWKPQSLLPNCGSGAPAQCDETYYDSVVCTTTYNDDCLFAHMTSDTRVWTCPPPEYGGSVLFAIYTYNYNYDAG